MTLFKKLGGEALNIQLGRGGLMKGTNHKLRRGFNLISVLSQLFQLQSIRFFNSRQILSDVDIFRPNCLIACLFNFFFPNASAR